MSMAGLIGKVVEHYPERPGISGYVILQFAGSPYKNGKIAADLIEEGITWELI